MSKTEEQIRRWKALCTDAELCREMEEMTPEELEDGFYRDLEFGTGGLRGVIGAGSNRMNVYTVRKATQGLADYLLSTDLPRSVAIAHDSRNKSDLFARETARVMAGNGITVYLYPRLEPTPALSWAVRYYGCGAGVCVTASHNPAQYNGYKVYGSDGCQITLEASKIILSRIAATDCFESVKVADFDDALESGMIRYIPDSCLDAYLDAVCACRVGDGSGIDRLKIVYTPLNGSGAECVTKLLDRLKIKNVTPVAEQMMPDGNFPTCPYPNPEIREAMERGLAVCEKVHPDLLLGTDPDCDRCGTAVPDGKGGYRLITGNEMGIILLDYICRSRVAAGTMPKDPVAVTTVVSTDMVDAIAKEYGVEIRRVLTGFKFIGEQIARLEAAGTPERYLFGFEESYGYLSGVHVRDKDGVNAALLVCEAAAYYAAKGMSLGDAIDALYAKYGYYRNSLCSFTFPGARGMQEMSDLMEDLRKNPPNRLAGLSVTGRTDYANDDTGLPASNVLEFRLEGGSKLIVRPSGTEPKIKFYASAVSAAEKDSARLTAALRAAAEAIVKNR